MGSSAFLKALALAVQEPADAGGMHLQAALGQSGSQRRERDMRLALDLGENEVAIGPADRSRPMTAHAGWGGTAGRALARRPLDHARNGHG